MFPVTQRGHREPLVRRKMRLRQAQAQAQAQAPALAQAGHIHRLRLLQLDARGLAFGRGNRNTALTIKIPYFMVRRKGDQYVYSHADIQRPNNHTC